jgi:hypothetical protein
MATPVLLLEFNELSPTLMATFMAQGHLPNFKRLHDESRVWVTDAQEAQENLEPWIQWVTVHTGLPFDDHGVFLLGDGPKCDKLRLWDILSAQGRTNWICGSMNTAYRAGFKGRLLPDPWTVGAKASPAGEFDPFLRFVTVNVQEHTNQSVPLSRADYVAFLRWMVSHGLSPATIGYIVRQLATEKLAGKFHWRRAIVLDRLLWDVFQHYFRRDRPDFATFFLNSTAHFQHLHWRNMDPEPFSVKPSSAEQAEYQNAVLYGYQQMDQVVGKALALAGNTHTIVFSSALGQQPYLKAEEHGGKVFYRPKSFRRFTEWVGLDMPHDIQPVMSEEFHLVFESEADAVRAEAQLGTVTIDGRPGLRVRRTGSDIMTGCGIFEKVDGQPQLAAAGRPTQPFLELFYLAEGVKSGMHHPDGILWIRHADRRHADGGRIPLTAVAPTILALQGVRPPEAMPAQPLDGLVDQDAAALVGA